MIDDEKRGNLDFPRPPPPAIEHRAAATFGAAVSDATVPECCGRRRPDDDLDR